MPNGLKRGSEQLLQRGAVRDVRGHTKCLHPMSLDRFRRYVDLLLTSGAGGNVRACLREANSHGETYPGRSANDDSRFAFEIEQGTSHLLNCLPNCLTELVR